VRFDAGVDLTDINWKRENTKSYGYFYDFKSVMHYPPNIGMHVQNRYAHWANKFGYRGSMRNIDAMQVSAHYSCGNNRVETNPSGVTSCPYCRCTCPDGKTYQVGKLSNSNGYQSVHACIGGKMSYVWGTGTQKVVCDAYRGGLYDTVKLVVKSGKSDYASCAGRYVRVEETQNNGHHVWYNKDKYRFIAHGGWYWGITAMQWYHDIVEANKSFGIFQMAWGNGNLESSNFDALEVIPVSPKGYEAYEGRYCDKYGYRGNTSVSSTFFGAVAICDGDPNCGGVATWDGKHNWYNLCGKDTSLDIAPRGSRSAPETIDQTVLKEIRICKSSQIVVPDKWASHRAAFVWFDFFFNIFCIL